MQSEQVNEIAAALAKAQGEIQDPPMRHMNPHFKKPYANMTDGLCVIRPALSRHGIAVVQSTDMDGGTVILRTRLIHTSGQWVGSVYPVAQGGQHQALAAALTYAKRQTLFALVGVHGDDDDDGNAAVADIPSTPTRKPAQRQLEPSQFARAEAEAYVTKALAEMADIESADRLNVWWRAEAKNRQLHFEANDDPLYVRLKDHAAMRGKELAKPVDEAAQ